MNDLISEEKLKLFIILPRLNLTRQFEKKVGETYFELTFNLNLGKAVLGISRTRISALLLLAV